MHASLCFVQEIGDLRDSLNSEVERLKTVGLPASVQLLNTHSWWNDVWNPVSAVWKVWQCPKSLVRKIVSVSSCLVPFSLTANLLEDLFVIRPAQYKWFLHYHRCAKNITFIVTTTLSNLHSCFLQEFSNLRSTINNQVEKATSKLAELVCVPNPLSNSSLLAHSQIFGSVFWRSLHLLLLSSAHQDGSTRFSENCCRHSKRFGPCLHLKFFFVELAECQKA